MAPGLPAPPRRGATGSADVASAALAVERAPPDGAIAYDVCDVGVALPDDTDELADDVFEEDGLDDELEEALLEEDELSFEVVVEVPVDVEAAVDDAVGEAVVVVAGAAVVVPAAATAVPAC